MSARRGERAALAAMVTATVLWGGTFVAIRDSVARIPAATLVCGRFIVATMLFGLLLLVRRHRPAPRALFGGMATGLFMLGGYYFQAEGLRSTSAGSSAFLTCAGTLFAAFFAWPLLRQRPSPTLLVGIVLALGGSALMSLDRTLQLGRGELLTLLGAAIYALQVVALARLAPSEDVGTLAFAQDGIEGGIEEALHQAWRCVVAAGGLAFVAGGGGGVEPGRIPGDDRLDFEQPFVHRADLLGA